MSSIFERVESLKGEFNCWKSFYEKLDVFLVWVEEMEGFIMIDKLCDENEVV